jgi:very-short-patch-repair endonuclease
MVACGCTNRQVEQVLAKGEARRLHLGVYLLGPMLTHHAQAMAAVLACGPAALVSHRSAAYLNRLLPLPAQPDPIDVTVTQGRAGRQRGIRVHRTTTLRHHERRDLDGIPITAPLRTVIDLASCCEEAELEAAVAESFARGQVNKGMLLRAVDELPGRRGLTKLRSLLAAERRPSRLRSNPERVLRRLLLAAGVDGFETNVRAGPWEVDFLFRAIGLVVEVDAYATHSSPWAFERDRRKTADLEDRGLAVHRVTDGQLEREPGATVSGITRRIADLTVE